MFAINDDGSFVLPAGAGQDFTKFLEQNGVACVGAGQVRTPFDPAIVQKLYLEWVKRRQRRTRRRIIITLLCVVGLVVVVCTIVVVWPNRSEHEWRVREPTSEEQVPGADPRDILVTMGSPPPQAQLDTEWNHALRFPADPEDGAPRNVVKKRAELIPVPSVVMEVDRILASLALGNIAYNTPSSMRCDEKTKIQLLLSPRTAIEELKQKISGLGEKVGEQIRVADVMEAGLYGKAFETHALRPERQAVSGADDTEWQWEIVAREPGNQELHLVISAVLTVNGREGSKVLKVYHRTIDVHVTASHLTRTLVATPWSWFFATIGAIGALVLARSVGWRRSRGDRRFQNVVATEVLVGKIKVLLFAANPRGSDPLDLNREFREIDQEIRFGKYRDALELVIVPGTRLVDLLRKLNEVHPNIVHFSGHGNIDEEIILESGQADLAGPESERRWPARDMRRLQPEDDAGGATAPMPLSKSALVDVLKACSDENIRVVVLNACHTRPQAEALSEAIDCVISMNGAISDVTAIKFASSFYGALAFGRSVKKAFDQGLARLKAEGISESQTPELIVRAGLDSSALVLVGPRGGPEPNKRVTK